MKTQILLIDDDPIINFTHTKIIGKIFPDAPMLIFENGKEALTHIQSNTANSYLIFLDLNMPVMNGWEFLNAIESEFSELDLRVHIVTSSIDTEDRNAAKNYKSVNSYLEKPLKELDLGHISLD